MTGRERWLAALGRRETDRVPFWPKLFGKSYALQQEGRFRGMSSIDLYRFFESDFLEYAPDCTKMVLAEDVTLKTQKDGTGVSYAAETPRGTVRLRLEFDPATQSMHPVDHPLKTATDILVLTDFLDGLDFLLDEERLAAQEALGMAVGQDGVTAEMVGESPLMAFVEYFAGIAQAPLLLMDHPGETDRLFAAMQRMWERRMRLIAASSRADLLMFVENTSTTMISPGQFARYCIPHFALYTGIAREYGRVLVLHMCGKIRALLGDIAGCGADGIEALTSPPIGDTTLSQAKAAGPGMCWIGGTNALLWTRSAEEIAAAAAVELEALPDHGGIVLSTGGMIPPTCRPETVREVSRALAGFRPRFA